MPARYNVPVPTTVFEAYGAQLREASGEDFSTLVDSGRLTITISADKDPIVQVDNIALSWTGEYKKIDRKDFMLSTTDLMTFTYITLPDSLTDAQFQHFEDVLHALKEGSVVPKPPRGDVPPTAAPAVAPSATHYPDLPSSMAHAPPPAGHAAGHAPPPVAFFDANPTTSHESAAFQHAAPPPATAATHVKTKEERDREVDHSFFGQVGAVGAVLQCVAQKAALDTAKLGQAFKDRAEQDRKRMQAEHDRAWGYHPV